MNKMWENKLTVYEILSRLNDQATIKDYNNFVENGITEAFLFYLNEIDLLLPEELKGYRLTNDFFLCITFTEVKEDRNYSVVFNHLNNYYYLFEEHNYIGKFDLQNKN